MEDKKKLGGFLTASLVILFVLLAVRIVYLCAASELIKNGWFLGLGAYLVLSIAIIIATIYYIFKRSGMSKIMLICLAVLDTLASVIMISELTAVGLFIRSMGNVSPEPSRNIGFLIAITLFVAALYAIWIIGFYKSKHVREQFSDKVDVQNAEKFEEAIVAARLNGQNPDAKKY